jgi:hypothetical protein
MKIWITRQSTSSLHAGGLERCNVWFCKPEYFYTVNSVKEWGDIPFDIDEKKGLGRHGWQINQHQHKEPKESISFGRLFGYGDSHYKNGYIEGLAEYVWAKLHDHYGNTGFVHGWYEYEKSGKCKEEDFILEIDIEIKFIPPKYH